MLIFQILHQCFAAGIQISATVCDMDGVNRRALSILGATKEHPRIIVNGKEIVTLFDTPHLLKCFRNLFLKYDIDCMVDISSGDKRGRGIVLMLINPCIINQTYYLEFELPIYIVTNDILWFQV